MPYQIDIDGAGQTARVTFHGRLDSGALEALVTLVKDTRTLGKHVALALATGTEVDGQCIDALRHLEGVTLRTSSPSLAHWLRQCGQRIADGPCDGRSSLREDERRSS